ncbi:MAG: hypothetical protein KatS3mg076_3109 [Candidatus Binatia bacterium]|nr:MAG: hypothetical protein KatS3mg076_3109 [Candidatus Binatia bacterium]
MSPSRFGAPKAAGAAAFGALFFALVAGSARSYPLDKEGTIRLGVRSYVNARIGTEDTDETVFVEDPDPARVGDEIKVLESRTFPRSPAGHLRQNRFFVEAELAHDLRPLLQKGFGPLALLHHFPLRIRKLEYRLVYRGEADGIYDWGPREFRKPDRFVDLLRDTAGRLNPPFTCGLGICPDIFNARRELRESAVQRHRLHQAHLDVTIGRLFLRIGRQNLAWGETDAFRLLDQINPIDSSFGGFLVSLDERRVPLDMILARYYLGNLGPRVFNVTLEGFASIDDAVSYAPGTPQGSPWTLPNLGAPSGLVKNFTITPSRTFDDIRGGFRVLFDAFGALWSVAHYYTFSDIPAVQACVHPGTNFDGFPIRRLTTRDDVLREKFGNRIPGCPVPPTDLPIAQERPVCTEPGLDGVLGTADDLPPGCRRPGEFDIVAPIAFSVLHPAKIQVTGATTTFTVPAHIARHVGLSGEPVIRSEFAYIKDEPYHRQSQLDPFIFHNITRPPEEQLPTGGILKRDSINFVLGIDHNQYFRFLNPASSFFLSTQFFYKHIKGHDDDAILPVPAKTVVVTEEADPTGGFRGFGAIEPIFVTTDADQFLQTFLVSTSYRSGTIVPSFAFFYEWSGARVYLPSVTFIHDPFRFTVQLNVLDAGRLKGNSGTSLLRDRDNVLFQLEYVI